MTAYYLLFNGPPSCGKSTLLREAIRHLTVRGIKNKRESIVGPMKQFAATLLGAPYSALAKDTPHDLFNGETPREFLIDLSERYLKRNYNTDFFGRAFAERTNHLSDDCVFVVDDSGFVEELESLNPSNVTLVRVIRPGFDFSYDSRTYLPDPNRTIYNDSDLKKLCACGRDVVDYCVEKWRLKRNL